MALNDTTVLCKLWPNQPYRCHVVVNVQRVVCCFSMIGCLLVSGLIVILKKHHLIVQRIILFLSLSAFFNCITLLMGDVYVRNSYYCRFQGFLMQYFSWVLLLWILVISFNCLLIVKGKNYQRFYYYYHAFVWLTALVWSMIPFFGNKYGPAGIWCWIKREETALRFGLWYIPLFVLWLIILGLYCYIIWFVCAVTKPRAGGATAYSVEEELLNKRYRDELKPLLSYPFIYLVFIIPIFMYRLDDATHPNLDPSYTLTILSVIFTPSLGFFNALAFAIFNASIHELTPFKLKQGISNCFTRSPSHVVHENYQVDEVVNPIPGNTFEMEVSNQGSNNGIVSYQV